MPDMHQIPDDAPTPSHHALKRLADVLLGFIIGLLVALAQIVGRL
jgi:hypothetical protein